MYTAIYRDFRPARFEELIGQDAIVRILKNQIATGTTGHAYLFYGTRGTGKTTTARILAKALNCTGEGEKPCCQCENCRAVSEGSFLDVVEIDAASNTGVDHIRDLRDSVQYPPVRGKNKIYIIDEVHMLSKGAFNALLKTLEEPPEHVVFILATTEKQKVPATILSRCIQLDFHRVAENELVENMKHICAARGLQADEGALALIASAADGSVRDSLSLLEQCIAGSDTLSRDDVVSLLGMAGESAMLELTDDLMHAGISDALLLLDRIIRSGKDVRQLIGEWLSHCRNLLMIKYIEHPESTLSMSVENVERLRAQSRAISTELLDRTIRELSRTAQDARWSNQPRVLLEMCIVRLGMGQEVETKTVFPHDGLRYAPAASATPPPGAGNPGSFPAGQASIREPAGRAAERHPDAFPTGSAVGGQPPNDRAGTAVENPAAIGSNPEMQHRNGRHPAQDRYLEELSENDGAWNSGEEIPPDDIPWDVISKTREASNVPETGHVEGRADGVPGMISTQPEVSETAAGSQTGNRRVPEPPTPVARNPEPRNVTDASGNEELDRLWSSAVRKAVADRPALIGIQNRTRLARMTDDRFYVRLTEPTAEGILKRLGTGTLEAKMEMLTGVARKMEIDYSTGTGDSGKTNPAEQQISRVVEGLKETFGLTEDQIDVR